MTIGLHELRQSATRLGPVFRSPLLPVFGLVTGAEALMVLALPGQATDLVSAMLGDTLLGIFSAGAGVFRLLGLVLVLFALDLFRTGLWSGMRRVALQDEVLTTGDIVRGAIRRMPALFVTQQIIGLFVFLVSAVCFVLGVSIQIFPHALVTFTFAPALYAVVAMRRPIAHSLSQAVRITRHNVLAVFGVQAALLAMAYWISEFFQGAMVAPLVGSYAAVTLLVTYRFATFFGMGTLFVALEEADEFER